MGEYRATCPVHGEQDAAQMSGGWYCEADDPARPEGICARPCSDPVHQPTGKTLEAMGAEAAESAKEDHLGKVGLAGPKREAAMKKEKAKGSPRSAANNRRRDAGESECESCLGDMAGENAGALRCAACREAVPTWKWSKWKARGGLEQARKMAEKARGEPSGDGPGTVPEQSGESAKRRVLIDRGVLADAVKALQKLGHGAGEARKLVRALPDEVTKGATVADVVKAALGGSGQSGPENPEKSHSDPSVEGGSRPEDPTGETSGSSSLNARGKTGSSGDRPTSIVERLERIEKLIEEGGANEKVARELVRLHERLGYLERLVTGQARGTDSIPAGEEWPRP